jgi:putative transposase
MAVVAFSGGKWYLTTPSDGVVGSIIGCPLNRGNSTHVVYQCSYHIVWCPKYRFRILKGGVARFVEETIRSLCEWKSIEILELSVGEDHVHAVISMPPKLSISEVMGILKGKTAIKLFKSYPALKRKPYWGNHFWSRGYCVSSSPGLVDTRSS